MRLIKENDLIIDSDSGELYFDLNNLPKSIQLNQCTFISDVKKFVISHFQFVNTYMGTDLALPYFDRLIELQKIIYEK